MIFNLKRTLVFVCICIILFTHRTVKAFPQEPCQHCKVTCLPANPKEVVTDENADLHAERLYCGHLFHLKCLVTYMKTPPFHGKKKHFIFNRFFTFFCISKESIRTKNKVTFVFQGGKKCPGCGQRVYHDKWGLTDRLAEARWAHQQARARELAEVEDFFN